MNKRKLVTLTLIQTLSVAAIISAYAASQAPAASSAVPSVKSSVKSFVKGSHSGPKDSTAFAEDLATALGLNTTDLKARLDKGETPDAIIATSGKTKAAVMASMQAAHLAEMKTKLQAEVASGTITQAQADAQLANMQNHTGGMRGHGKKSKATSTTTSTQ